MIAGPQFGSESQIHLLRCTTSLKHSISFEDLGWSVMLFRTSEVMKHLLDSNSKDSKLLKLCFAS